jgi:hypothetical protein
MIDERATIATSTEMRDLARVLKAALGVAISYWQRTLPRQHPYYCAARMVVSYLEQKYNI